MDEYLSIFLTFTPLPVPYHNILFIHFQLFTIQGLKIDTYQTWVLKIYVVTV